jgi:uncharacterized protein (DUF1810 family)
MPEDPFDLQRFVTAQSPAWDDVCAELRQGRKQTHWMWFVFPQLAELGRSATAKFYGLSGADEAKAYLAHPILGARLRLCCETLMQLPPATAVEIFGTIDAMKLRSCLTLFAAVSRDEPIFQECLLRYFGAGGDPLTLKLLAASR